MKSLIKKLLREGLLMEDIYPYTINDDNKSIIEANFTAEGLEYLVQLARTDDDFDTFDLTFTVKGQAHDGERQGKDSKHAYRVFQTVFDFTENMVKKHKIKKIALMGAGDEKDSSGDGVLSSSTSRSEIYYKILSKRYSPSAIKKYARHIWLDMTIVFPELFNDESGKVRTKLSELVAILFKVGGGETSKDIIRDGVNGDSDESFSVDTEIEVPNIGHVVFEINVYEQTNEYDLTYEILDTGEEKSRSYRSFDNLITFLEVKFLSN